MADVSQNTVGIRLQVTGAQALAAHFKRGTQALTEFNNQIGLSSALLGKLTGIMAATLSVQTLVRFFKAAQESAVATAQLSQALRSTGQSANATTAEFVDMADALQRSTGFSDELVQDVQRILLTLGRTADEVRTFTPLVLDMAAAMGVDATTAARQVAVALEGSEIVLGRYKITAKDATDLAEKMTEAFGGQAEVLHETKGPFNAFLVSLGELEEALGRILVSGSEGFWKRMAEAIDQLTASVNRFNTSFPAFGRALSFLGSFAADRVASQFTMMATAVELYAKAFSLLVGRGQIAALRGLLVLLETAQAFAPPEWLFKTEFGPRLAAQINVVKNAINDLEIAAANAGKAVEGIVDPKAIAAAKKAAVEAAAEARRVAQEIQLGQLEIARDTLAVQERLADTDQARVQFLQGQLVVQRQIEAIMAEQAGWGSTSGEASKEQIEAQKKLLAATTQRLELERAIAKVKQDARERTFAGGAEARFKEFQQVQATEKEEGLGGVTAGAVAGIQDAIVQLGTAAQQVGRAMTTFIGGAVDSIAGGIRGLLSMTMTWGDALRSIAGGIMDSVIDAISRMFAEWIVGRLLTSAVEKTASATELAAKAPVALMTSISSYGVAAALGIAAMLAAMAAMGGFESGGFTGAGPKSAPAGIVHRGEYVVPASAVSKLGLDWFDAAAAGTLPPASSPGPAAGGRPLNQNLNVYLDRRAWLAASRDDIEAIAIDAMARSGWRTPHA